MIPPKIEASVDELYQHLPQSFRELLSVLFFVAVIWFVLSPAYVAMVDRRLNRTKKLLEIVKLRLEVEKVARESDLKLALGPYADDVIKDSWWAMVEDLSPSPLGKHPWEKRAQGLLIMVGTATGIFTAQLLFDRLFSLLPWQASYVWFAPLVLVGRAVSFLLPFWIVIAVIAPRVERRLRGSKPFLHVTSLLVFCFEAVIFCRPFTLPS